MAVIAIVLASVHAATVAAGGAETVIIGSEKSGDDVHADERQGPIVAPVKRMPPQMPANAAVNSSSSDKSSGAARSPAKKKQQR